MHFLVTCSIKVWKANFEILTKGENLPLASKELRVEACVEIKIKSDTNTVLPYMARVA